MVFGKKQNQSLEAPAAAVEPTSNPRVMLLAAPDLLSDQSFISGLEAAVAPMELVSNPLSLPLSSDTKGIAAFLVVDAPSSFLVELQTLIHELRNKRSDGLPVVIVATALSHLMSLGTFLQKTAQSKSLQGLRLIAFNHVSELVEQVPDKLAPILEPSVLGMPSAPELNDSPIKYFYAISPELRSVVSTISELANNNVNRIYLLGGPGTGKTSLSYYYWLVRQRGKFVTVNLNAESTDDKAAMKSLLCGHVTGAFPGASGREGALSHAGEGVCFLDESHGVTGVVMQVLMEVLDSGQFLPFGGTSKRPLECAVLFASNRSWETLRSSIPLDEHARLGATLVAIPNLANRPEDTIAVIATILDSFKARWKTWVAPEGLSSEAWAEIRACAWNGNTRTLIRVLETAAITHATEKNDSSLLTALDIKKGVDLWEPEEHESLQLYAANR